MSPSNLEPPRSLLVRRFATLGLMGIWLGGFAFYGSVVIELAARVLGSHLPVGFVTERVSNWFNGLAALTLLVLVWTDRADWPFAIEDERRALSWTWGIMAVTLGIMVTLHFSLDTTLDFTARRIAQPSRFDLLHHGYLALATIQWIAGVVHLWYLMVVWQR